MVVKVKDVSSSSSIHVFVYGTLRPGGSLFNQIQRHVRSVMPDTVRGDLWMAGGCNAWFPVLTEGNGYVTGMVIELPRLVNDKRTLEHLDLVEGVSSCLYKRVSIKTNSGRIVWAYYGDKIELGEEIRSGDFFEMITH